MLALHNSVSAVREVESRFYDCRIKPKPTDKASVSRIKYITYDNYLNEFALLWDLFGKKNMPKAHFDKYATTDT